MKMATAHFLYVIFAASLFLPYSKSISPDGEALLSLLSSSSSSILQSWNPNQETPCSWQGITCSPQGRVISLSLPNTFLNLTSIPAQLSSLTSLQLLNLSSSNISGSIPPSLGSLYSLHILDLSSNALTGTIPQELSALSSLQYLYLNSNRLSGSIPSTLSNLTSLQVLCLQDNFLNGSIPKQLGSLNALEQFRIGGNPFLSGEIPKELGFLANLTTFGAASTSLSGSIPKELGNLINLQTLALYDTDISGSVPRELGMLSELRNLYLHLNRLTGSIPTELGQLQKLTSLLLWGNMLTGSIPTEISNCSQLVVLDLSANRLSGNIPSSLGTLAFLEQLHLSDNMLNGTIPVNLCNCSSLTTLQLDKNEISGVIPLEIGELKYLQSLFLWGNLISGTIPSTFGNCSELYALDLSNNKLTGSIPDELFGLSKLSKLLLLGNELSGKLPVSVSDCQSLVRLRLGENKFGGEIPKEIGKLQNLVFLDLYSNNFTGTLPKEIANITVLELFDIHNNSFSGEIPYQLGELVNLEQLDLSNNKFSGEVPESFGNFSYLNKLIMNKNYLSGDLPETFKNLQKLTLLDLSCNNFSGPVPSDIGSLSSLSISLNLSFNKFSGEIPEELSQLTQLQSLDISSNLLNGSIEVLGMLTSLTFLNMSYNNFSGPFPVTPFFRTLPENSYLQNSNLYHENDGSDFVRSTAIKSVKLVALVCVILGCMAILFFASWIVINKCRKTAFQNKSLSLSDAQDFTYPWTFTPFQKLNFTVDNILECLIDENIIGKGCSGVVYKAEMPNGEVIAVKKLWKTKKGDNHHDAFASEIQILGHIRHRNIVKLLGYCSNKHMKLLLFNYISNGNLQQLMQERRNLDWEIRYKIAIGSAQGLAYLHHDCVPAVLHRDVKSNNILLDSKYEAYIADFGLAKLMHSTPNYHHAMSKIAGSYGYIAPEYGYTGNITEKSDVYSYGVVLLELLTGRSAIGPTVNDGLHIVEYVKKKMSSFEPAINILDSKLRGLPDQMVQEMLQTLGIAMFCVNSTPSERPSMKEVAALLMEVKSSPEEMGKTSQQPLIKSGSH